VILPSVIPPAEVAAIRQDMERVYAEQGRARVDHILNYLDHSSHSFSKYLADERILDPVRETFGGQHVRVRSNAGFFNPPREDLDEAAAQRANQHKMEQGMHADGPFLQGQPVRVAAPYQDATVQFTTIWMLSDFTDENGATQLLTGSHRSPTNPTANRAFAPTDASEAAAARMGDLTRPDPAIVTAAGKAGDVILFDNRVWCVPFYTISLLPSVPRYCRACPRPWPACMSAQGTRIALRRAATAAAASAACLLSVAAVSHTH
jgi:ectoine hydroxylase-related dioxygenase (phytanoyl-CoA dioxygenase family)